MMIVDCVISTPVILNGGHIYTSPSLKEGNVCARAQASARDKRRAARYRSPFGVYRDEFKTLLICVDPRLFQFYAVLGIHVMPNAYVVIPANSTRHSNQYTSFTGSGLFPFSELCEDSGAFPHNSTRSILIDRSI